MHDQYKCKSIWSPISDTTIIVAFLYLYNHDYLVTSHLRWRLIGSTFLASKPKDLSIVFIRLISCSKCTSCPLILASLWCFSIWLENPMCCFSDWRKEVQFAIRIVSSSRFIISLSHRFIRFHWDVFLC